MRPLLLLLCVSTLLGCASAPGGGTRAAGGALSAAEQEVVRVANSLFAAMLVHDTTALRRMIAPEARIVAIRLQASAEPQVQIRPAADFIASIGRSTDVLRERMWNPSVEVGEGFASLWAPYDFHVGDRFSHCGFDALHLARRTSGWVIVALSYTIQTEGCPAAPGEAPPGRARTGA